VLRNFVTLYQLLKLHTHLPRNVSCRVHEIMYNISNQIWPFTAAHTYTYTYEYIHSYIHTYIRTYIHTRTYLYSILACYFSCNVNSIFRPIRSKCGASLRARRTTAAQIGQWCLHEILEKQWELASNGAVFLYKVFVGFQKAYFL
jgi:hypothetical protein